MRPSLALALALVPAVSGCLGHVLDDRRGAEPTPPPPPAASADGASSGRACTPASEQRTVLAEGANLRPIGLVPDGTRLWFVNDETTPASDTDPYPNRARSAWHVSTTGGSLERSDIQGLQGTPTTFEGNLAYVRDHDERGAGGAWERALVIRDRTTGVERVVHTVEDESVTWLWSHPSGLYWTSSKRDVGSTLFRFTEGRASAVATDPSTLGQMIADSSEVYYFAWREIDGARRELRLESRPLAGLAGGDPHVVSRLGDDARFTWSVIGVSGDEIFVTVAALLPEPSTIRAIAKDGGRQRIVARVGGFATEPILDGDLLTWVDGDTGRSILQTTVAGAGVDTFVTADDGRRFGSVAVDACNVYWTAAGEDRSRGATIYAKARARSGR